MSTLTEVEISKLRERGFEEHLLHDPRDVAHWRQVAKLPLSFFYGAQEKTFMRELDRRQIPYQRDQDKSELLQLLLDAETEVYRVICRDPTGAMHDVVFPVQKDVTMGRLLKHYNRAAKKEGRGIQFTSISCEGTVVSPSVKMSELASVWQSSHIGIERNIIMVDAH